MALCCIEKATHHGIVTCAVPYVLVTQSCPTLSNPMDCSLPGSSVHGIFQARALEWDAIAFSQGYMTPNT